MTADALPVTITADSREIHSGIPAALERLGANVEARLLTTGDYDVGGGALVERKRVRDLYLTLVSGRLWDQVGRLRCRASMPYLLVEGWPARGEAAGAARLRGILLAVLDLGVPVIPTVGSWSARSLLTRFGSVANLASATPQEWQEVQGIGPVKAEKLRQALILPHPLYRPRRSRG